MECVIKFHFRWLMSTVTHPFDHYRQTTNSPERCRPSSDNAVDTTCRPHYNAPARLGYWLILSLVAEQGPTYAAHASLAIRSASAAAVPLCSRPFLREAATPQSYLISSPAGGASPASARILYLQRSCTLAPPASDAIVTAAHACVLDHASVPCCWLSPRHGTAHRPRACSVSPGSPTYHPLPIVGVMQPEGGLPYGDTVSNPTTRGAFAPS